MITLTRTHGYLKPLEWAPVIGIAKAIAVCANGHQATISDDHDVDDEGKVTPSLVCPSSGCDWHEYVRLEGWTG